MGRKRHKPEEIVAKLRQVEVLTTQGQTVAEAIRSIGVTEVTTPPSSAGRSAAGPKAGYELTLRLDHPMGAGHPPSQTGTRGSVFTLFLRRLADEDD